VTPSINEKLDALREALEEGRGFRVGTVRRWKGGHYQKTDTGWVPVKSNVKVTKPVGRAPHATPTPKQGQPFLPPRLKQALVASLRSLAVSR
jgi:hypothetical protein